MLSLLVFLLGIVLIVLGYVLLGVVIAVVGLVLFAVLGAPHSYRNRL